MEKVSERALIGRINRKLGLKGLRLHKARSAHAIDQVGRYFILAPERNIHVADHVDLERYGRQVGALQPNERLAEAR